jgi:putative aminopeptidase FrvX
MLKQFLLVFLLINFSSSWGQINTESITQIEYLKSIVSYLASDSLHGRATSSSDETLAADFIFNSLKMNKGLKPKKHFFSFKKNDMSATAHSQNVYCYVNNHADSTIVIGAHYDHIGLGGELSLAYSSKNKIHNGADDNASGVALMLALARDAKIKFINGYNYLFVAYSAHEIGLYGSTAFYSFVRSKVKPIALMINFDMVGRMDAERPNVSVFVSTKTTSRAINYFKTIQKPTKISLNYDTKIFNTDCRVFESNGIESISLTTGTHSDYHKPTDDEEKINYQGINLICILVTDFVNHFSANLKK